MCRKYFSRREKIFPNSQIDVFPPFTVCTSRLLCELTQWVEYKFHVFGFLPSNSSIHAILPLRRISLNCIKLTFVVKFQFVFRLEPILYLFVIVPSKFPARFANQVKPLPQGVCFTLMTVHKCRLQASDKYSKHATDKCNIPKYKYRVHHKIQLKVANTKHLNHHHHDHLS